MSEYSKLTDKEKKAVKKAVKELQECGSNLYYIETGGYVEKATFAELVKFVLGK